MKPDILDHTFLSKAVSDEKGKRSSVIELRAGFATSFRVRIGAELHTTRLGQDPVPHGDERWIHDFEVK
jgi:uncharacterized membrane protein (UPF0127 family)